MYKSAIDNGIPDGIARSFKGELKAYKKACRDAHAAAALTELQYGPGGFIQGM